MKKYILMLFAVVAAFTSCTNDDIAINYATNFKINPATVIKPFTFENEKGELEGIPSSYNLRIRLLIYTAEGQLVKEEKELFTSYASTMGVSTHLPVGDYIAISCGNIVAVSETPEDAVIAMLENTDIELCEIITLFVGKHVSAEKRAELTERLSEIYDEFEIAVYEGGQDVYDYLVAVE